MSNKYLKNRLNKEEALKKIAQENFQRKTLSFYRYVDIYKPQAMRDQLFRIFQALDCYGRIYIAKEGINAQMNIPQHHWNKFEEVLQSFDEFKKMPFKHAIENPTESFWKLSIKVKDKIVADGLDDNSFDTSNVGKHLNAKEFNEKLENPNTICVDMRNFYESEVGHFQGAICPEASTFHEELPMVKEALKGKENSEILLYCTGGVRCEKASAYMKHHGFKNVNQLHGGIIQYTHEVQAQKLENKFKGINFVFDERMGERISDDVLTTCHQCGAPCDTHTNCANKACNLLFIQCDNCKEKYGNCCSRECDEIAKQPEEKQKEAWKTFEKKDNLMLNKNPFRRRAHHNSFGPLKG